MERQRRNKLLIALGTSGALLAIGAAAWSRKKNDRNVEAKSASQSKADAEVAKSSDVRQETAATA